MSSKHGFTLIEFAISLIAAGVIMTGILLILNQADQTESYRKTNVKIDIIIESLSTYVDSNGRLPCPADPSVSTDLFGWEWGVTDTSLTGNPDEKPTGACGVWGASSVTADLVGIIPFATLGLHPSDAKDGWGRYFTYAVSPVHAQDNDDTAAQAAIVGQSLTLTTGTQTLINPAFDDDGDVHKKCLDSEWIVNNDNIDGLLAKFCCHKNSNSDLTLRASSDIQIFDTVSGNRIFPNNADDERYNDTRENGAVNVYYDDNYYKVDPNRPAENNDDPGDIRSPFTPYISTIGNTLSTGAPPNNFDSPPYEDGFIAAVSFTLISHGENGAGAFQANNTMQRLNPLGSWANYSDAERENGADSHERASDQNFFEGPLLFTGANYFDDIVVWRTQQGIVAETGAASCSIP